MRTEPCLLHCWQRWPVVLNKERKRFLTRKLVCNSNGSFDFSFVLIGLLPIGSATLPAFDLEQDAGGLAGVSIVGLAKRVPWPPFELQPLAWVCIRLQAAMNHSCYTALTYADQKWKSRCLTDGICQGVRKVIQSSIYAKQFSTWKVYIRQQQ